MYVAPKLTAPQGDVVFSEDFSKFTAGTEAEPDNTDIGGSKADGFVIDSQYLNQPGWFGAGVHQAGGACAIKMYEYQYEGYPDIYTACGYISTPETELFGELEITFRAKKITDRGVLWVGLCDNDNGPVDSETFELTGEWQSYSFKSDKGTFAPNNVVQFAAQQETELLIDDIVITRAVTKTEPPMVLNPINNSFEEFVARWTPTKTAEKYRLNVYKKVEADNYISGTLKEGFDNINVKADGVTIDEADPNYPEGWKINVSEYGSQDMNNAEGCYYTAPRSIILDEEGDVIETPETPAFINSIRFWIRPSSMAYEDENISMISVNIWDSKLEKWIPIANMPNYYFQEEGTAYEFNSDQIGLNVNKVRFEYIQKGDAAVSFFLDNIEIDYETQMVDAPVLKDYETTDTFCVVKDIDPSCEHFYYVQAIQGDLVSDKTPDMWVDAITGLKPVINEPTNVTGTGFDISWTKFYNARSYSIELCKIMNAEEDMNDVVILEENFDKILDGTLDSPGTDWAPAYDFAEHGMCDTQWTSFQAQWIKGMAGTRGTNAWTGIPGFIASPVISLNNNGGAFTVELTVLTLMDDDEIAVMIQPDLNENATMYKTFKCTGKQGSYSGIVEFESGGVENCHISVMSMNGNPFYLDKIKITQNMKKGEMCTAPYKSYETETNEYMFFDLPENGTYGVEVTAKGMKDYVYYTSEKSDRMIVATGIPTGIEKELVEKSSVYASDGAIHISGVAAGTKVEIFNIQGQLIKNAVVNGSADILVNSGVYVVNAGNKRAKVIVR